MAKPRNLKPLPSVTREEASAAVTQIGGVLFNLIVYHAAHFRGDDRQAGATKILDAAKQQSTPAPFRVAQKSSGQTSRRWFSR
jgi:hypothetical protein